ncbi:MAG: twin-arginine translocase TatA/TatE family subunit [Prevotella sp.]
MTRFLLFIGISEFAVIAGIVLLLFGGKKMPEIMHGLGKGVNVFKKGTNDVLEPLNEAKKQILDDIQSDNQVTKDIRKG